MPGLQVWALDRRSQALEDTSRFADALAGRISPQQAFDYYLGWLSDPSIQPHFQPLDPAQLAFAKQWGLSLTLQDVRRVVLSARRQGKRVILGGHSLGASMTVAYASWDFDGHPGYEDLDGLVLIDGGLLGSFSTPDLASTKQAIKALALIHVRAGMLGPNGDWVDGEVTPLERLAQTFGQEPANATEWYFPAKLSIDVDAVDALTRNAQSDYLKLRPWHRRAVDLPLYVLQTDLTHGHVLRGARAQQVLTDGRAFPAQAASIATMSERTSYDPGVPSWVDVSSPDVEASKRFYAGLFGWDALAGPADETGGYAMFQLNGRTVAGLAPIQDESQPPMWSVYVATDDADAAAARVSEAGGDVLFGPTDVMDAGRLAVFAHPAGGMIGTWQAGNHTGAALVDEPGALNWNELQTRDVEGAKAFYAAVFGWQPEDQEFGGVTYTMFNVGDVPVAGAMPTPSGVPDEVPAFWLSYFSVEDCDASMTTVQELGGSVFGPAHELAGVGRFAIVADPHGATFGVIAGEPPDE